MRRGLGALAVLLASLLGAVALLPCPRASAQGATGEPDLTGVSLRVEDLPPGFGETADLFSIDGLIAELLTYTEGAHTRQHRVFASFEGTEVVESLLIGPLTAAEQAELDARFADVAQMVAVVADAVPPFGMSGTWAVRDTTIGDSSFACWITATEAVVRAPAVAQPAGTATRLEVVLARRGAYLLVVAVTHDGEGGPVADAVALAETLDRRLAAAPESSAEGFRPSGLLEPELTTHLPTPTDISTDAAVIGTNLLLASLVMLAFISADLVLDATLAQNEARLRRALLPARWFGRVQQRLDGSLAAGLRRGRWPHWVRLVGIVGIYGLVFSFLEPGWHPFSVTGLYLFITMAVSCGVIGQLSGMLKYTVARRYGLSAEVGLRPANLLIAAASLGFSRAFSLYPGLMMGRPVAYRIDEESLEPARRARLLEVGAYALAGLAAGAWLLTIPTSLWLRADPPAWLRAMVGGVQALLLVMFAVGLQNLFREMLALPRAAGRHLSRHRRLLWVGALAVVTFAFWHTLVNPDGTLAAALRSGQVRFFLLVAGGFVLFAAAVWAYGRHLARRPGPPGQTAGAPRAAPPAAAAEEALPSAEAGEPAHPPVPSPGAPPADWYPDPTGRHQHRYWDGARWTAWVADAGVTGRDPLIRG
jgi:hypothetical protein